MHELFIWAPTKGWKLIKRNRVRSKLVELATELEPLETKISSPNGRQSWAGRLCLPDFNTPQAPGH